MATDKVTTQRHDRAFVVTINRPKVRNCIDGETAQGLFESVEAFKADDALDAPRPTDMDPAQNVPDRQCQHQQ